MQDIDLKNKCAFISEIFISHITTKNMNKILMNKLNGTKIFNFKNLLDI